MHIHSHVHPCILTHVCPAYANIHTWAYATSTCSYIYVHTCVPRYQCTCIHWCALRYTHIRVHACMPAHSWKQKGGLCVHKYTHACNLIIKQSSASQCLRKHTVPLTLTASVSHSSQALGVWSGSHTHPPLLQPLPLDSAHPAGVQVSPVQLRSQGCLATLQ